MMLPSNWTLFYFPYDQYEIRTPEELFATGLEPIPAQVPGNVELDLQHAGLLPDPFFADNIRKLRDLENTEWWYVGKFNGPPRAESQHHYKLTFDGLDTFSTIWLNDHLVGETHNMLIPHSFDVTKSLMFDVENTLVIRITPAMEYARQQRYEPGMFSWEHRSEGLRVRKAPHMWGWDIMPRAVSAGIWRKIRLDIVPSNEIEQIYIWTADADPKQATIGVFFHVRSEVPCDELHLQIEGSCQPNLGLSACEISSFTYDWPLEFITDTITIPIEDPCLWWPVGYGEPNQYKIALRLYQGDQILAERAETIGIRKLELKTDQDEWVFVVNHTPIFIKGTNWVPLDAFHSRDEQRLHSALEMVADLGCNMIRCWGGNVYELDSFYEWCDAHGVLVWQDFAFACNSYPQDEGFLAEVRREVEVFTTRIRNHPSLAVWCGDNEIDMVFASLGRDPETNRLTREVIPQTLQRIDPYRSYLPSSPYISPDNLQGQSDAAEQHLWGPRGYFKAPFYSQHTAHFIGEIGYHGCNEPGSISKFISSHNIWPPTNEEWQIHSVYHWRTHTIERDRIALMANQIRAFFGEVPTRLEDFALASQLTQAEALKYFVESTRQRKWCTSGILWWNLLDGWPQFSDAVVDYYFAKKIAYHYLWRVQRPVLVFFGETDVGLGLWIANDTREKADVLYRVRDANSDEILSQGRLTSPANQNRRVADISLGSPELKLLLIEWEVNGELFGNHYLNQTPPVDFAQYLTWLQKIADLPRRFIPWYKTT